MPARLVSSDGLADILLDRPLIVVGRHRRCTCRIESIRVSRHHCCLVPCRDGILVHDLGSTNGTWINGRRVEEEVLRPGDELAIAHHRYYLEIGREDERTPTLVGLWLHALDTLPLSDIIAAERPAAPAPGIDPPGPPPPDAALRFGAALA